MSTAARTYRMLGNESLWQVANRCHDLFESAGIEYGICGGVAVCLHGYRRNTIDVDLIIRSEDNERVCAVLEEAGFRWGAEGAQFVTEDGHCLQFLTAGDRAGKGSEVRVVEPAGESNVENKEGLSVVRLSRLIEIKLACGLGNLRRTHKDFADVVELIVVRKLDNSFARILHNSVRPTFSELVRNANSGD